jgi:AraC family transcriptional regulator
MKATMRRRDDSSAKDVSVRDETRIILVGAEDELPSEHVWYEGSGYSIYAAEQPRSSWREHTHDCVQVTIGLEPAHVQAVWGNGSKASGWKSGQREISGNIVSIIQPGEPHSTLWQRRAILIHLYLSKDLLAASAAKLSGEQASGERSSGEWSSGLRPVYLMRDLFIEELGRVLFRECQGKPPRRFFAEAVVTVLTAHLLRNYGSDPSPIIAAPGSLGPARERRVREHIERSLDGDLSIHALAQVVGMNAQYFANAFRLTTGFTPHRYVSHRRIGRAQQLLVDTKLSLTEIAYQCGFKSQSQFTTLFRQFTGMTPGRFRAR